MGLDIAAYSKITKLDIDPDADAYDHDGFRAYINTDFPGRADDVEDRANWLPTAAVSSSTDPSSPARGGHPTCTPPPPAPAPRSALTA